MNQTIIGEKDTQLILRGTNIKAQWGNKFIDIIKNGKIVSEDKSLFYKVNSESDIVKDGIYLINESIWICVGGIKIQLGQESATISYLQKQELTNDQKQMALTNIGFQYNTLGEAKDAGVLSGLIYIKDTNKLYCVSDGQFKEYVSTNDVIEEEQFINNLVIKGNSLYVGDVEYILCENGKITIQQDIEFTKPIGV